MKKKHTKIPEVIPERMAVMRGHAKRQWNFWERHIKWYNEVGKPLPEGFENARLLAEALYYQVLTIELSEKRKGKHPNELDNVPGTDRKV